MLLANVFENFRDVCLDNYGLDPANFYTAHGLTWKAALNNTKIEVELLMDNSMLLMFEKDIRRGINQVVYCYAKANKKYIGDQYNADKESSYLQYHDANNLYGWAMAQDLPTYGFK